MVSLKNTDFAYEVNDVLTNLLTILDLDLDEDAMDELLNDATYAVCDLVDAATRPALPVEDAFTLMDGSERIQDMLYTQSVILLELDWIELDEETSRAGDLVYIPTMNGLIVSPDGDVDEMMQVAERDHADVIASLDLI